MGWWRWVAAACRMPPPVALTSPEGTGSAKDWTGFQEGTMNKSRLHAYRILKSGLRYHQKDSLKFLTVGTKRNTEGDLRYAFKMLTKSINRQKGIRPAYFCSYVREPDRCHFHVIWNAPYIVWTKLVDQMQEYLGESCSVYINRFDGSDKAVKYIMQYSLNQEGDVRYSCSRNWLPKGYSEHWKAMKHDFWHHVPRSHLQSDSGCFDLITQNSITWRKALIEDMNRWIDEKKDYQVKL